MSSVVEAIPWREAWQAALYGPHGFYRRPEGPAGHFTTSTHGPLGALLAEAVAALAERESCAHVVDVGCGRGELLTHLASVRPGLALTGVDIVDRPADLPETVRWIGSPGGNALPDGLVDLTDTLVLAHEWLDVVPCTVAGVDDDGVLRDLLVAPDGSESLGAAVSSEDARWADRWWPDREPGDRVEVGRQRDDAWAGLLARVTSGTAVAVDYGHTVEDRPPAGTLTAYVEGTLVTPVPDGSCDITAHVAVDSLRHDAIHTQRDLLRDLGVTGRPPAIDLAHTDPGAYLHALSRSSVAAALLDPMGLGAFRWVIARVRPE